MANTTARWNVVDLVIKYIIFDFKCDPISFDPKCFPTTNIFKFGTYIGKKRTNLLN